MDLPLILELFRHAIVAALLAGLVCPLIGAFLLARRSGFHGVALPQFAACGVACGYALLPWWLATFGLSGLTLEAALESPHAVRNYALCFGAAFTFGGLGLLLALGRRTELESGRLAGAFALAWALTILFADAAPAGREFVEQLLRGEILTVDVHELETLAVSYAAVLGALLWRGRELLLVAFDRDTAHVLGLPVRRLDALFFALTGLTVSAGVLVVGPVVLFGLLVLPPLAAHGVARSWSGFLGASVAFGVLAAAAGLAVSFGLDLPLGPSICAVAGLFLALARGIARLAPTR